MRTIRVGKLSSGYALCVKNGKAIRLDNLTFAQKREVGYEAEAYFLSLLRACKRHLASLFIPNALILSCDWLFQ